MQRQDNMGHLDVSVRLQVPTGAPLRRRSMSLEKGPSTTLPAQGVDTFPTGTPHLLRLAWIGGLLGGRKGFVWHPTPTSIPCFGAPNQGHGKCVSVYGWRWGRGLTVPDGSAENGEGSRRNRVLLQTHRDYVMFPTRNIG